jgi:hypothetical protein
MVELKIKFIKKILRWLDYSIEVIDGEFSYVPDSMYKLSKKLEKILEKGD